MSTTEAYGFWEARFTQEMRRLRELLGISQTELARRLREHGLPFHQQTVQKVESNERPVRLDEAFFIAQELGVSLAAMTSVNDDVHDRDAVYAVDRLRRAAIDSQSAVLEGYGGWYEALEEVAGLALLALEQEKRASLRTRWMFAWLWKAATAEVKMRDAQSALGALTFHPGEEKLAAATDPVVGAIGMVMRSELWHDGPKPIDLAKLDAGALYDALREVRDGEHQEKA